MSYSDYEYLKVETADRVATLTINRPDVLNAVNSRMHHELEQIWLDLAADRDVNAILFTGAGRAFCAGGDVKGMAAGQLVGGGPGDLLPMSLILEKLFEVHCEGTVHSSLGEADSFGGAFSKAQS